MNQLVAIEPRAGRGPALDTARLAPLLDCRILIVDDDAIARIRLQLTLKKMGFRNIALAVDGRDALARAAADPPDLVLLDIMMPEIDGFEVCRRLRAEARFGDMPILVQTSLADACDRVTAFRCGASDVVTKPINRDELIARVSIQLERRRLIRGLSEFQARLQEELTLARQMQLDLLPSADDLEVTGARYGVDIAAHFEPCSEIGGDLWGVRAIDATRFAVYIVDFAGHGVGAALNTFRLQTMIASLWCFAAAPAAFLEHLNVRLCEALSLGQFATILFAVIDVETGWMDFAAAGAPAAAIVEAGGGPPCLLDGSGLPLGLLKSHRYPCRQAFLPAGSSLFLVSDAFIETRDGAGAMLDAAGFGTAAIRAAGEGSAPDAVVALVEDFARRAAGPCVDDLTVLCLRR